MKDKSFLLLLTCIFCLFTCGSFRQAIMGYGFDLCTSIVFDHCETQKWLSHFQNEAWYPSVQLPIPIMPPGKRGGWCDIFFNQGWSGCLEDVAAACTDNVMKATVNARHESQTFFCNTVKTQDYEHYWSCLGRTDTQNKINTCHSTFTTTTANLNSTSPTYKSDYCQFFHQEVTCHEDAAKSECGEEAAMYAAKSYHQFWHLIINATFGCSMTPYTPPADTCDVAAATICVEIERVHWNVNKGKPDCTTVDQRIAKAHGCVFKNLYNCDTATKQGFYQTDLYRVTTLVMNQTLTRCLDTPASADASVACTQYTNITLDRRSSQYVLATGDKEICDTHIDESHWYRFNEYTGGEIPEGAVNASHCGTQFPVWMKGKHPRIAEFEVDYLNPATVDMCTSVGSDTCFLKDTIQVRNCRENKQTKYFVYNLRPFPTCEISYCAGNIQPCQNGFEWNYQINQCRHPNCTLQEDWNDQIDKCLVTGSSPTMNGVPTILKPYIDNGKVVTKCVINYPSQSQDDGSKFIISWLMDSQDVGIPSQVASSPDLYALLDEQYLQTKKSLSCSAQSYWSGWNHHMSAAQQSAPYWIGISVSGGTSVVVDEANEAPVIVTISSSVPFACTTPNCINVGIESSPNVILEQCTFDLSASDQFQLKLKADRTTSLKVDSFSTVINFHSISAGASSMWNNYVLPDINVEVIDKQTMGICSVTGNSLVTTFDAVDTYALYQSGQYLLFSSSARKLEVHIRTQPCPDTSCTCGIVMHDEGLVYGIDFCNSLQLYPTIFSATHDNLKGSTYGSINAIDTSGMNFQINMPSGASAEVFLRNKNNIHSMDIFMRAPAENYGKTSGLCGSWDDNVSNDITGDSNSFVESHRCTNSPALIIENGGEWSHSNAVYTVLYKCNPYGIQKSHFEASPDCSSSPQVPYCSCSSSMKQCTSHSSGKVVPFDLGVFCDRKKRSVAHHVSKRTTALYAYPYNSYNTSLNTTFVWPTPSGISESDATNACQAALQGSMSYQTCQNIVNISSILYTCKEQIKISDNLTVTSTAVNALEQYCIFELQTNLTLGSSYQISTTQQLNSVVASVCPAQCSGRGTCVSSTCVCDTGYTGSDCGLQAGLPPRIWSVEQSLLDIQQKQWSSIRVFGYGFWSSVDLKCKMRNITLSEDGKHVIEDTVMFTSATMNSAFEVICEIPVTPVHSAYPGGVRSTEHGIKLSITTDGTTFSEEVMIVVYDSACRTCQNNGVCSTKANMCHYDGVCQSGNTCKDPCVDNIDIGNPRRSMAYNVVNQSNPTIICDQIGIGNGKWYRFDQYTGSQMPESCVQPYHCATHSPIWLNGTHPTAQNPGPISAQVCANKLSSQNPDPSCCEWMDTIQVKYCGLTSGQHYHVYQLKAVPECEMAYCSGSGVPCNDGYEWNTKTQACQDINECLSNPCQNNGNCSDHLNYFTCTCQPGFTGQYCQININECAASHECKNGGSCVDGINSYSCACMPGYTGSLCEEDINECDSSPCRNGGQCVNLINSFKCQCASTFTGILCQFGEWGAWSGWSGCSTTCGHGYKQSSRQCTSTAQCVGQSTQHQLCSLSACPNANEEDDLEGAIITLPSDSLLKAIVNEGSLVSTTVAALNFYCKTNAYDFCSSFQLDSKMQSMKPESSMITSDHISLEYLVREISDGKAMIQVIVTVEVRDIDDFCVVPNMGTMPERVYLKDIIVKAALIGYTSQIEQNTEITVSSIQTTAEALRQPTEQSDTESTKVPIIVAGAIFGTVALIIIICIVRGLVKSKFSKPGAKRTISKISVNPILGPDSRPTTPASIFSASQVNMNRPFSGMSNKSGWSSRPLSAISAMSNRPWSASRPLSSSSALKFKERRPNSGASTKSSVSIIPPTHCSSINSVLNPRVANIYEGLLNDKSNLDDRKIPGQPTKSLSFNFKDLKPPRQPGAPFRTFKRPLLPKQPPLERDGMPTAATE